MAKKWDEILYYDETSPSGARWKVEVRTGDKGRVVLRSPGDVAGTITVHGYWQVTFESKSYRLHRVIMELHGIDTNGVEVDHIDGNKLNNVVSNLRCVSTSVNKRNLKRHSDSTSIKTGVVFVTFKGVLKVVASWYEDGKQYTKSYSTLKYGLLPAQAKACAFRDAAISKLNSMGYGYTERHGK